MDTADEEKGINKKKIKRKIKCLDKGIFLVNSFKVLNNRKGENEVNTDE